MLALAPGGFEIPLPVIVLGLIIGSIVIPLAILTTLCWFFWKHRHDD